MRFEDLFSRQAQVYARFRPRYPDALFAYLASIAPTHDLAWDCATGSGQAALGLAGHFKRVAATDASVQQIAHALPGETVKYWVGPAEHTALPSRSVDLVTTAQAVHWFDLDAFYQEVQRVLKPAGVLAVWCYHLAQIDPAIDRILAAFYFEVTGPFWPSRIRLVDEHYRSLSFPFDELIPPAFVMEADWDLSGLTGFLNSWSVVQTFIEARGRHPLKEIQQDLLAAWGEPNRKRRVQWPLYFRIGRVSTQQE
jgi:SAM-dependent methyltransferase